MDTQKPNLIDKFKALPKRQRIAIIIGIILILGILGKEDRKSSSSRHERNNSETKSCIGNEGCISKVRENFSNSGKTILGEQYLGNGKFGISFMDSQHPGAFNTTVYTDCNCAITNVSVSTIR
jgi:hypothetical protein